MNLDFTLWTSMYRDKDNKAIDAIDYKLEVKYINFFFNITCLSYKNKSILLSVIWPFFRPFCY